MGWFPVYFFHRASLKLTDWSGGRWRAFQFASFFVLFCVYRIGGPSRLVGSNHATGSARRGLVITWTRKRSICLILFSTLFVLILILLYNNTSKVYHYYYYYCCTVVASPAQLASRIAICGFLSNKPYGLTQQEEEVVSSIPPPR